MITEYDLDEDLRNKLNRLGNDRDALYLLIDEFRGETRDQFDALGQRMGGLETLLAEALRRRPPAPPT